MLFPFYPDINLAVEWRVFLSSEIFYEWVMIVKPNTSNNRSLLLGIEHLIFA
jgi:hypothetical protein